MAWEKRGLGAWVTGEAMSWPRFWDGGRGLEGVRSPPRARLALILTLAWGLLSKSGLALAWGRRLSPSSKSCVTQWFTFQSSETVVDKKLLAPVISVL